MPDHPSRGFDPPGKPTSYHRAGKSWFFGIGINQYQHFTNLNNAVKDVKDLISLLQKKYGLEPDYVRSLYNEEASREKIISMFDWLQKNVGREDKLLIYFSGHGHLIDMGEKEKGFWIPVNAKKNSTAQYIRNSTILDCIDNINSLHTLLISDSCFSGSLFVRGGKRAEIALNELEQRKSRWAICSGRHDEQVYDGAPGTNSPFASSILDILSTNNKGKLNVARLADRVVALTRASYKQLPEGNPLFGVGHKGGQYVFCLKQNEDISWEVIRSTNTMEMYWGYIKQYPRGKYAKEALQCIENLEEDLVWNQALDRNQMSAYSRYLIQYPDGRYVDEVHQRMKALEEGISRLKPAVKKPTKQEKESKVPDKRESKFGTFTDPRDGQEYKTVEINGQTWMAENLNYNVGKGCWVYDKAPPNEEKYGRLYTWDAAHKACPPGWHLLTDDEWKALANYYGGYDTFGVGGGEGGNPKKAYAELIAGGQSGFDALLGGGRNTVGNFVTIGVFGTYWTATEIHGGFVYHYLFHGKNQILLQGMDSRQDMGLSLRCLKNDDAPQQMKGSKKEISISKPVIKKPIKEQEQSKSSDQSDSKLGTYTDPRDGQVYKTVEINGKTWLAENLNYDTSDGCWFYNNDPKNGEQYGRLYTWRSAQKACPPGWHLPTDKEWKALLNNVNIFEKVALQFIKSDLTGIDGLFGGFCWGDGTFKDIGVQSNYWSITKRYWGFARCYGFSFNEKVHAEGFMSHSSGLSVRCLKD